KATMEVEAVDEGTMAKIVVPAGTEGVKVNAVIAVLALEGEDVASVSAAKPQAAKAAAQPQQTSPEPLATAAPVTAVAPQQPEIAIAAPRASTAGDGRIFASPLARRIARDGGVDV